MLRVRLCGGLEVEHDGRVAPDALVGGRQGRLVLAYLVCERHRPVSRDELADLLWGERPPDSWSTSLSAVVSRLRRMLGEVGLDGASTLASVAGSYQLVVPPGSAVDLEELIADVEAADAAVESGDAEAALVHAARAEEIAAKGFLADDCEWVDRQRAAVLALRVRSTLARSAAHLLAGSARRAVEAAREAVALDPVQEAAYRQLMGALAAAGERAEALRVWEHCRITLVEELGIDPSPETEAMYLEILQPQPAATRTGEALPSGVVTFLLTDIVGSTALWDQHPAAMADALERHDALVADTVAAHGGALLKSKLEGDATVSVFARATACVAAALALLDALETVTWPDGTVPTLRMAMHTGEAFERDGDYFGPALNRAARLRSIADAGQVLLSQAVAEVVVDHLPPGVVLRDLGFRELRGLSRGENVYALTRADAAADADPARSVTSTPSLVAPPLPPALVADGPFVGRDDELVGLEERWQQAERGEGRAVFIGGEPGVGKSRLAAELSARAHRADAVVLYGRCDEDLSAPLQPFIEAMRTLVPVLGADRLRAVRGVDELARVVPEVADLLPSADTNMRADPDSERLALFDAITEVLRAVADAAPVLLVLDDLHWAGKTTLSLLRHVLRGTRGARLLVVGTYRDTELGRAHPLAATLADLRRDALGDRVALDGLDAADVVAYLAAVGNENRAFGRELAEVTSGNPFFVIEVVRHIDETGGRWEPGSLPEGVREATGRRLSRLSDQTNEALTVAAVAGASFDLALVEQVRGTDLIDDIAEACRAGLVAEEPGSPGRFRFAHALVRQVLLSELVTLKRVRLHRTIAELLEAAPGADEDVHLVDLAHHWYECASTGSATKAVDACRRAADRAMERLAYEEAGDLYGMALQALENAESPDPETADALHLARCDALLTAGDVVGARRAIDALEHVARGSERLSAWYSTYEGLFAVLAEPDRLTEIVRSIGAAASAMRAVGDLIGEAKAHYVHASALERLGQIGAAERALDDALAAARSAGDVRLADAILAEAPPAALWGPRPVTRASGSCLDVVRVLRITKGAPAVEAVALRCQAVLEALRGRFDAARRMVASSRRTVERLGLAHRKLEAEVAAGFIELLAGDAVAAEALLRPAYEELRDRGLDGDAAQAAAFLGRALLLQRRYDEADDVATEAATLAGSDLKAGIAWRDVRAEAAAKRGDLDAARALAEEAVALATATDALVLVADARLTLATVLYAAGDEAAARAEAQRAIEVCEAKGATALLARVRAEHRDAGDAQRPSERGLHVEVTARASSGGHGRLALANAIAFQEAANRRDFDAVIALRTPHLIVDDRRPVLRLSTEASRLPFDQLPEVLGDTATFARPELVEARGERVALLRWILRSPDFEVPYYGITRTDAWGRNAEYVMFDEGGLDDARAALDEVAARAAERRFDNDAVELVRRDIAAYNAGDIAAVMENMANDSVYEDRRSMFRDTYDRDRNIANARIIIDGGGRFEFVPIATRGRRMELSRWRLLIPDPETDAEVLGVRLIDERGRHLHAILFDPDDLDEAVAELDRIFAATEGAAQAALIEHLIATAADRGIRVLHLPRLTETVGLCVVADTEDATWVELFTHDGRRVTHVDRFPVESFDEVLVHLEGITEELTENAAARLEARAQRAYNERVWETARASDRGHGRLALASAIGFQEAANRRDFDAIAALRTPHQFVDDRRRILRMTTDVSERGDEITEVLAGGAMFSRPVLVEARGERVGLFEMSLGSPDFEVPYYGITRTDAWGRVAEYLMFDEDELEVARAALDEVAARAAERRFDNDAVELVRLDIAAYIAGDIAAVMENMADDNVYEDRRSMFRDTYDRDGTIANARIIIDGGGRFEFEPIATRGQRIELSRWRLRIPDPETDVEVLNVNLVDERGRHLHATLFDPDDLDEAMTELDRMFAATEGAADAVLVEHLIATAADRGIRVLHLPRLTETAGLCVVADAATETWVELFTHDGERVTGVERFPVDAFDDALVRLGNATERPIDNSAVRAERRVQQAYNERDWEYISAGFADGYVQDDRRSVIRVSFDKEQAVAGARLLFDGGGRFERETVATRGEHLVLSRWTITIDDQQADFPVLVVNEFDDDGRYTRTSMFDEDDLAAALAELDRQHLRRGPARDRERVEQFGNAAWDAAARMHDACNRRDFDALLACMQPDYIADDRRTVAPARRLGEDGLPGMPTLEVLFGLDDFSVEGTLLATRGDRLALIRRRITFVDGAAGSAEVETLNVIAVDNAGLIMRETAFDPHRLVEAYDELDARFVALGGPDLRPYRQALAARDWDRFASFFSSFFVLVDERQLGWRRLDLDAFLVHLGSGATDAVEMWIEHVVATGPAAHLTVTRMRGTSSDDRVENPHIALLMLDAKHRIRTMRLFDLEDLHRARECFDRLTVPSANAAWRTTVVMTEAINRRDAETLTAAYAPASGAEDRRFAVGRWAESGGESYRIALEMDEYAETRELLATRGDRLALTRTFVRFRSGESGPAELETLSLVEVDDDGRVTREVWFDPDDLAAAHAELDARELR